jgi:GNAT superfamily N-acetyltransferase
MILRLRAGRNPIPPFPGREISVCRTSGEASEWAASSLEGFGSEPEHREPFAAFAASMTEEPVRDRFRLLALSFRGRLAATALLTLPGKTAGLFYFSVLPKFRRLGLGNRLLDGTLEEALKAGCSSVALQASPMGFPLYKKFGFRECGRFLVHSTHPDAC